MSYSELYQKSINNPKEFWRDEAGQLSWFKEPQSILSGEGFEVEWFKDGELNMSYLCIDKHIADGYGEQTAIIYDSPVTDTIQKITYNDLKSEVAKLAGALLERGLKKGDAAIIYMPMIPQAVYAMLACARIGVTHSVVFGGFAAHELAIRIDDCQAKAIITASNGVEIKKIIPYKELVDEALRLAENKPNFTIVFNRNMGVDYTLKENQFDYKGLVEKAKEAEPVSLPSTHPLYILYTSGTTGKPKGIIRDTGGYATALNFTMSKVYGVEKDDVYWAASDVGWVVGHSYIVYGPLIHRNTTILFEGKPVKTPDSGTFWRVIEEHKVNVMFTAPTAIRAIKREDPNGEMLKKI